jgi:GNAT superfamily N-acetyltransferase
MDVRALRAGEVALFKDLRLRALADSPDAFAETLAHAEAQPAAYWENLTRSVSEPGRHVMFVAEDAARAVGLVFGLLDRERASVGRVGGMWVAPEARGRGAGRALLDAVVAWARRRGLARLELWVTEGNSPAALLYRSAGFAETGARDVLPANPARATIQMTLALY